METIKYLLRITLCLVFIDLCSILNSVIFDKSFVESKLIVLQVILVMHLCKRKA